MPARKACPPAGPRSGSSDVANFGAAYLFGIVGVTCCLALILFGTPAVRRNVRVVGLAIAGAVLAVLVAADPDPGRHLPTRAVRAGQRRDASSTAEDW